VLAYLPCTPSRLALLLVPLTLAPTRHPPVRTRHAQSAYDDDINIVVGGADSTLAGTSAACPMVAGMLGSINAALAAAGHATLGFANPFLYKNEAAFLDITRGNNRGIAAVKGFDPVSGLGTFSTTTFAQLKASALKAAAAAAEARASRRASRHQRAAM
jgi:hypothetical protein